MSRIEKLVTRFCGYPSDFSWDELVSLLNQFGFSEKNKSGSSHRTFFSTDGKKIFLTKPHPSNIVKRYALKQTHEKLIEYGMLGEKPKTEKSES